MDGVPLAVQRRPSDQLLAIQTEDATGAFVRGGDPAVRILDDDALIERGDHGTIPLFALAERRLRHDAFRDIAIGQDDRTHLRFIEQVRRDSFHMPP